MQQVLTVIDTLFSSSPTARITPAKRKEADDWLKAFQKTVRSPSHAHVQPQAWEIADALISSESAPLEARLFAAQTFRQKVFVFL